MRAVVEVLAVSLALIPRTYAEQPIYVSNLDHSPKAIVISDQHHRSDDSRVATVEIVESVMARNPNKKVCLFLETTPQVHDIWRSAQNPDSAPDAYETNFKTLSHRIGADVPGLTDVDRQHTFIELQPFMEAELRGKKNLDIFGADFDYEDHALTSDLTMRKIYSSVVEPANARREDMLSTDEKVRLAVAKRNQTMCKNINENFRKQFCEIAIVSLGSAHVEDFKGDKRFFPGYKGPVVGGVPSCLTVAKQIVRIDLKDDHRICDERNRQNCDLTTTMSGSKFKVSFPDNYFATRLPPTPSQFRTLESSPQATK